jgi:hypothetical protein
MKMYFKGGSGIKDPTDVNGVTIKEGDVLTFDWFEHEDPISYMRKAFTIMKELTDDQISDRIHKPTYNVKLDDKGILFGEGIEDKQTRRLYLHDFRFKYTKKL